METGTLSFGDAVKHLRVHLRAPRERIASEVGVTASAVCYWETAGKIPTEMHLLVLAKFAKSVEAPAEVLAAIDAECSRKANRGGERAAP